MPEGARIPTLHVQSDGDALRLHAGESVEEGVEISHFVNPRRLNDVAERVALAKVYILDGMVAR